MTESPFHPGERAAQEKAGEAQRAALVARGVGEVVSEPVAVFIKRQNMAIATTRDDEANIWISLLVGKPGFLTAVNERTIRLDSSSMARDTADPFWRNIGKSPKIGMLFIEPATRRRFRVNGTVAVSDENILVSVEQAYPNCPKYIRQREVELTGAAQNPSNKDKQGTTLTIFTNKFDAYDESVTAAMKSTSPILTKETTMWKACWGQCEPQFWRYCDCGILQPAGNTSHAGLIGNQGVFSACNSDWPCVSSFGKKVLV